ncbi:MAG: ParA family protein, partial [Sphingomonadales bacterium]
MATVISVAQQKGGAGKTSLAVHLGVALAGQGRRVTLIDSDPQKSLTAWHGLRPASATNTITVATAEGWRLPTEVARLGRASDIIIIDTPPHAETAARLAVRESDRVLIPVQPTPLDVWATTETLDLIGREGKPCIIVLNRV